MKRVEQIGWLRTERRVDRRREDVDKRREEPRDETEMDQVKDKKEVLEARGE